ncbi:MAG: 5-(carboxyamino)imidazole ribonucleotide mutase [Pseudobdellovibrionaceae bacterium]
MKKRIAIIMGSQTDLQIMNQAAEQLDDLKIPYHLEIVSAHRTPEKMVAFAKSAADTGFQVIIAGAGGAAHLPGMVASLTRLPVIGVPIQIGKSLKGLDALLSIVQMPKGIPVATVAIDNATNAALLAARILGTSDEKIAQKLEKFQKTQVQKVKKMNLDLKKKRKA